MKKITFTLLLIQTSIVSQSQNLSMSELIPIWEKMLPIQRNFLLIKDGILEKSKMITIPIFSLNIRGCGSTI